jgi:adenylate cyclase
MGQDDLSVLALHGLERRSGTAVIIDVVASVRRIEKDELATVVGWVETLKRVILEILPAHEGRLVKSLGDGALIEFPSPPQAVQAALAIQKLSELPLRIGIEVGEFLSDVHDIYGRAVNRAARLMALSEAGAITISDGVRATLAADIDASIEDLGLHHLKHINEPVRAFRVGPPGMAEGLAVDPDGPMLPTLAIIPFGPEEAGQDIPGVGDILCDELIRTMSVSPHLRVTARLSTTVFRNRQMPLAETARRLNARFLVQGRYRCDGNRFSLQLELLDGRTSATLWHGQAHAMVSDIYAGQLNLLEHVPVSISRAIINRETRRAKSQELPTLENYSLLLAAIALMNSYRREDFKVAGQMLDALLQRAGKNALVHVWRAQWLNVKLQQSWSSDTEADGAQARYHCQQALEIDPEASLAFAVDGLIMTTFDRDLVRGMASLNEAVRVNPNEPMAWLYRAANRMFAGDGNAAVLAVQRAKHLAPYHPATFMFDTIAACASFVQGDYAEAERLALKSLKVNRLHASPLRVLAITQLNLGREDEARITVRALMDIEPKLTVSGWIKRSPATGTKFGTDFATGLRALGVPE